jgi:hypothetical protein
MTCKECLTWLPSYVDAEVGGLAAGQLYPEVKRHLDLCDECEVQYVEMLELALAEDTGELPVPERMPSARLTFLPRLSLQGYVRSLAEELVAATSPNLVDDMRDIVDVFFERVAALGNQFTLGPTLAPALGFGAGKVPEALKLLAMVYAATQVITASLSPQDIKAQARTDQLQATLRGQAENAGLQLGLGSKEARALAMKYAELASRDPEALQELSANLHD